MSEGWKSGDLELVWERLWAELETALTSPGHPWRTPVLATAGDSGGGRVVVLRRVDGRVGLLDFFTDLRSPKLEALRNSPWVTWVFYSPSARVQVRVRAQAMIHAGDAVAGEAWDAIPERGRRDYSTVDAPGTIRPGPFAGEYLERAGVEHFSVVRTHASSVDWLCLDEAGHRRIRWDWNGAIWVGRWVTP